MALHEQSLETPDVDGRKDAAMESNGRRGKCYPEIVIEEHYFIVGEPHEFYLSHVTPA